MIARAYGLLMLLLICALAINSYAAPPVVGSSSIKAPAVLTANNTGSLTVISLTVSLGDGHVNVTGPAYVASSTIQSAETAAQYASAYLNMSESGYNFTYHIGAPGENVSGPSAGAAMTLLAISALESKPLRTDFSITGTIGPSGNIGEIGGVFDKVSAASLNGLKFVLVPKVAQGDLEDELYMLVQTNFGIPLVQVANISQAVPFAFDPGLTGRQNMTTFQYYTPYNITALPPANITCSNQCNMSMFSHVDNGILNLTSQVIASLGSNPKFYNASLQFNASLNQGRALMAKGYLYAGADLAFLTYINAYYFDSYATNGTATLDVMRSVQSQCAMLNPPQLTKDNYEYVIAAELRQLWGNYTINSDIAGYNNETIETDVLLNNLYDAAQSKAWCTLSQLVYNISSYSNSSPITFNSTLKSIAYSRITRADNLIYNGALYPESAQAAYNMGEYPAAILSADYQYALTNASSTFSGLKTGEMINQSMAMALNATYGAWPSQFANSALFYAYQARLSTDPSQANGYAQQAFSQALLASQLSTDMKVIGNSVSVLTISGVSIQELGTVLKTANLIYTAEEIAIVLLVAVLVLSLLNIYLFYHTRKMHRQIGERTQRGRSRRKRRR